MALGEIIEESKGKITGVSVVDATAVLQCLVIFHIFSYQYS